MRCNCHDWLVFRPIINIGGKKRTHRSIVRICLRAKVDGNFNVITIDCGVHGPPRWSNVSHYTAYSWRDRMLNPILRTTTSVQERPALHQYEISDPCDSVSPRAVRPYAYNLHNFNYHNRTSTTAAAAAATTSTTLRETVDCTVRDWSIDPLVRVVYRYCRLSRIDRIDIDNVVVSPREPATVSTAKCKEKKKKPEQRARRNSNTRDLPRNFFLFFVLSYTLPCPSRTTLVFYCYRSTSLRRISFFVAHKHCYDWFRANRNPVELSNCRKLFRKQSMKVSIIDRHLKFLYTRRTVLVTGKISDFEIISDALPVDFTYNDYSRAIFNKFHINTYKSNIFIRVFQTIGKNRENLRFRYFSI